MSGTSNYNHFDRLYAMVKGVLSPPLGRARIALALLMGITCHLIFSMAVIAMMVSMFFGLSMGQGLVPWPWAIWANALLVMQFPLGHSILLSTRGRRWLNRIIPGDAGRTLSTTTYAIIASLQLFAPLVLWTPSGIIWWRADGTTFWILCACYAASWLLLAKARFDTGLEVQSGGLGWLSLLQNLKSVFPDMPQSGLFRIIRQPIYLAFALTLWTVPIWTPDQYVLAVIFTAYCLVAPRFKEKRFASFHGPRFASYKKQVPYVLPRLRKKSVETTEPIL